jgi:tetratricopeptide (TPR) repeat protein
MKRILIGAFMISVAFAADGAWERGLEAYNYGESEEAIKEFSVVIKKNPKHEEAYYYRAYAYSYMGESDKAIADFSKTIELNPKNHKAYYYRGVEYADNGEYDKAIADFGEALKIDPNFADAYMNRGVLYNTLGDTMNAKKDIKKGCSLGINCGASEKELIKDMSDEY